MNTKTLSHSREQAGHSLRIDLCQFTGTQRYYYQPLYPWLKYTDGVRFFMQEAKCWWLLDKLGTELAPRFAHKMQFWSQVQVTVTEEHGAHILVLEKTWNEQRKASDYTCVLDALVPLTDMPLGTWSFVFNHRVMCLPQED